jgi:hypothetical protein
VLPGPLSWTVTVPSVWPSPFPLRWHVIVWDGTNLVLSDPGAELLL